MKSYDVIVIGGGPAGSATAIFLARAGYRVALLDQATFPRDKVCGEFISPAADSILEELGVLASIEALSPMRLKGVAISSYEKTGFAVEYPSLNGTQSPVTSLSLPRFALDDLMLKKVREAGVDVKERHKVTDFIFADGNVAGVVGRDGCQTQFSLPAKVVVDAGGRNSISIRRFGLKGKNSRSRKIALAAHWEGVQPVNNYCYMHISPPGYTGTAPTGKDQVNVVLVVDKADLPASNRQDFYIQTVLQNRLRRELLNGGHVAEKVRMVDSLAFSVKPPATGGLILVGDATGFIDPFTGEGVYLALRSAQMAAGVVGQALNDGIFSKEKFSAYEDLRRREFDKKFLLSRILQRLIYNPSLCNRVVHTLSQSPDLAKTMVGVIGDYIPAEKVVSFKFLVKLLSKSWKPGSRFPSIKNANPQYD